MTTAKTTFKRATEENLVAYNRIIAEAGQLTQRLADSNERQFTIDANEIFFKLTELKPYLFPETNKVNY